MLLLCGLTRNERPRLLERLRCCCVKPLLRGVKGSREDVDRREAGVRGEESGGPDVNGSLPDRLLNDVVLDGGDGNPE